MLQCGFSPAERAQGSREARCRAERRHQRPSLPVRGFPAELHGPGVGQRCEEPGVGRRRSAALRLRQGPAVHQEEGGEGAQGFIKAFIRIIHSHYGLLL